MAAQQIECTRLVAYAMGWNDAMCGRVPRESSLSYVLGYLDARK